MTAALMCDACGRFVSTRNKEAESGAAEGWFAIERNPIIMGPGLRESERALGVAAEIYDNDDYDEQEADELLTILLEPALHLCSTACLKQWVSALPDDEGEEATDGKGVN